MNGVDAAAQMPASRRAIRQINFSDSITQGPRMNAGAVAANDDRTDLQRLCFCTHSPGKCPPERSE